MNRVLHFTQLPALLLVAFQLSTASSAPIYTGLWTRQDHDCTPRGNNEMYSIHAAAANNIWAVGMDLNNYTSALDDNDIPADWYKGLALHYNGYSWDCHLIPEAVCLGAVFALDESNVWVGETSRKDRNNIIWYYNGHDWTPQPMSTGGSIVSIHGLNKDDIWAIIRRSDYTDSILHYDGTTWKESFGRGDFSRPSNIFAVTASDVWAIADDKIIHYDGTAWSIHLQFPGKRMVGLSGKGGDCIWAASREGDFYFYNGHEWTSRPNLATKSLFNTSSNLNIIRICAVGDNEVWALTVYGRIAHFINSSWSKVEGYPFSEFTRWTVDLYGLATTDSEHVWFATDSGIYCGRPVIKKLFVTATDGRIKSGDPINVDVEIQPISQPFDAWGLVIANDAINGQKIYSFKLCNSHKLRKGAVPLAQNVSGLKTPIKKRIFSGYAPHPKDLTITAKILIGLVPPGKAPSINNILEGCFDGTSICINNAYAIW